MKLFKKIIITVLVLGGVLLVGYIGSILWLEQQYRTAELIEGNGKWGGVGAVFMP